MPAPPAPPHKSDETTFEDAMTLGMNALADGITRSIDLVLPGGLLRLFGINWSRLPARMPPDAAGAKRET